MGAKTIGQFEQIVLVAVCVLKDEAYGRAIYSKVCELAAKRKLNMGAVYVTLERFTQKGFLGSWMADPTPVRGGRAKRYYRLQAKGVRALRSSLVTSRRIHEALQETGFLRKNPTRSKKRRRSP